MAKWGGEGIRRAFSRESGRSSGRRVRCLRKTCHTRTLRTEREPRLLDSLVAAILLLADGEGESGVAEEEEKNGRFIVRFGRRAHPLFLRKFLGSRPSLRRPRRSRRRRSGIGDGGAAAEDITGRERRMNICKLQRATPSGGSRIGDQSQERRERDGKKRSGDHHDARPSSQLASTFGQTREICIKADDAGEERGRGRRCENSNLGGMYVAS